MARTLLAVIVVWTLGCGDDSGMDGVGEAGTGGVGGGGGKPSKADMEAAKDPTTPLDRLPETCVGFEVLGTKYSPGGDTLPNKCAPFHSTHNNPYAVRCIDADPDYETGYFGDEYCILPPEPELGMQLQIAPDDYEDPDPDFMLAPGTEVENFYYQKAGNDEQMHFFRVNIRMRPGSHHMINHMTEEQFPDGWSEQGDIGISPFGPPEGVTYFPGAQRVDEDRPGTLNVPPEQEGFGAILEINHQFMHNLHHFNVTDEPVLREAWMNVWWVKAEEVTEIITPIYMLGNPIDVSVPDGERRVLHYACNVPGKTQIVTLQGHRHASTDRFAAWLVRASGEETPLYESYDYLDTPSYRYDSLTTNPPPDMEARTDGAASGILNVGEGDQVHFLCDITNRSGGTLSFANEVKTGEMCILFGSLAGDQLCDGFLINRR